MKKVEYRCYQCMTVESKWLANNVKSDDYIICNKCGGESKRISSELIYLKDSGVQHELKRKADRLKI